MVIINPADPARYKSTYAVVVTPAEVALRRELANYGDKIALTSEERKRIADKLRATWTDEPES